MPRETLLCLLADACHTKLRGKQSPRREFLEELKDGCDVSLKLKGAVTYKRWCCSQASSSPSWEEVESSLHAGHCWYSSAVRAPGLLSVMLGYNTAPPS